ncbi:SDR family NAD(P)-dependent oxidoreductase [Pseudonocardia sp. Cha107L01]|uniref:SDR family NAD(P)-dependent oxidoreductase n=1 Tax=Pseudonocardia sp. Cha107L01 TaxID=3457576 RepID=UPI00403E4341
MGRSTRSVGTGVQLADKIVLVTGAAGGVGRVVAARMAAEGAKTVLLADLAPEPLTEAAASIEAAGALGGVYRGRSGQCRTCRTGSGPARSLCT